MGDKSPKSKERGQKQKDLAKQKTAAAVQSRLDQQKRIPPTAKPKK
jgi:hypothetical protein